MFTCVLAMFCRVVEVQGCSVHRDPLSVRSQVALCGDAGQCERALADESGHGERVFDSDRKRMRSRGCTRFVGCTTVLSIVLGAL